MDGVEFRYGAIVAHNRAVEMPFAAQYVAQQPPVLVRGHTVYLVITGHHGGDTGALHDRAERREEIFAQFALADRCRRDILAALRLAMPRHMLERRHHLVRADLLAFALQAQHRRHAHFAAQIRILAKRLLDPPPARIAGNVHHRRQCQMDAARPDFTRNHGLNLAHQVPVEAARHADSHGEHGGVGRHIAMQRFFMKQHRNAQAGFLDRPSLHGFDEVDSVPGRAPARADTPGLRRSVRRAPSVGRSRDLAETGGIGFTCLGRGEGQIVHHFSLRGPKRDDLADLFLQRHPAQKIAYAQVYRRTRILIERPPLFGRRRGDGRKQGCGRHQPQCLPACETGAHGVTVRVVDCKATELFPVMISNSPGSTTRCILSFHI